MSDSATKPQKRPPRSAGRRRLDAPGEAILSEVFGFYAKNKKTVENIHSDSPRRIGEAKSAVLRKPTD